MRLPTCARSAAIGIGLALAAPACALAGDVTVFAAASMTDAMAEIETAFEDATGHEATVSLAGSSVLARQIQLGAPADVFISANSAWMDALESDALIAPGTQIDLLGNRLALIAHDPEAPPVEIGPDLDLAGMLDGGKLAMALLEAFPAGIYGKAALDSLGLWEDVADNVAQTDNVRAALALVATGEAPYGIVYASDAVADDSVTVVGTFPADSHPPIIYPVADITGRDTPAEADFMDFLRSPDARKAFERQGFTVLDR